MRFSFRHASIPRFFNIRTLHATAVICNLPVCLFQCVRSCSWSRGAPSAELDRRAHSREGRTRYHSLQTGPSNAAAAFWSHTLFWSQRKRVVRRPRGAVVRFNSRLTVRPMCPPCAFSSSAMAASLATWPCVELLTPRSASRARTMSTGVLPAAVAAWRPTSSKAVGYTTVGTAAEAAGTARRAVTRPVTALRSSPARGWARRD